MEQGLIWSPASRFRSTEAQIGGSWPHPSRFSLLLSSTSTMRLKQTGASRCAGGVEHVRTAPSDCNTFCKKVEPPNGGVAQCTVTTPGDRRREIATTRLNQSRDRTTTHSCLLAARHHLGPARRSDVGRTTGTGSVRPRRSVRDAGLLSASRLPFLTAVCSDDESGSGGSSSEGASGRFEDRGTSRDDADGEEDGSDRVEGCVPVRPDHGQ